MSAPRGYANKTGKGRATGMRPAVREVETIDCPDRPGPHWLRLTRAGVARYVGCRRTWSELDAEVRAA